MFLKDVIFTEVDDETIRNHFLECGNVTGVRIVRDRNTGIGKGFGYVLFEVCQLFNGCNNAFSVALNHNCIGYLI